LRDEIIALLKRKKKSLHDKGLGMAERLPDEFLSRKLDALFDAYKGLMRALIAKLVDARNDQAGSGRVGVTGETRPAQRQKLWTVAEIAECLRVEPRMVYM
jgi:hypothetical protein